MIILTTVTDVSAKAIRNQNSRIRNHQEKIRFQLSQWLDGGRTGRSGRKESHRTKLQDIVLPKTYSSTRSPPLPDSDDRSFNAWCHTQTCIDQMLKLQNAMPTTFTSYGKFG